MAFDPSLFPNLRPDNHQITSPVDSGYNCVAWAAGYDDEWWEPVKPYFWPPTAPVDVTVDALVKAFESEGFVVCAGGTLVPGIEKVAIYADQNEYMHAALQLDDGRWTSKMGPDEDIEHDTLQDVAGPCFGQVEKYMQRPRGSRPAKSTAARL